MSALNDDQKYRDAHSPVKPHIVIPKNAACAFEWLTTRGGIAVWDSSDPLNPGGSWTAPVKGKDGKTLGKPHVCAGKITRTITDPGEVAVAIPREVDRFNVAVCPDPNNRSVVDVAKPDSQRIRQALEKWRHTDRKVWCDFVPEKQEVVIYVENGLLELIEYLKETSTPGNKTENQQQTDRPSSSATADCL